MAVVSKETPVEFTVRRMVESDLSLPGCRESMEALSPLKCEANSDIMKTAFRQRCAQDAHIFVAIASDEVVGLATVLFEQKLIHKCAIAAHVEDVAVRPDFQRKGVGKALMAAIIEEARQRRAYKVVLDCIRDNVPFYEKCGFYNNCIAMRMDLYYDDEKNS